MLFIGLVGSNINTQTSTCVAITGYQLFVICINFGFHLRATWRRFYIPSHDSYFNNWRCFILLTWTIYVYFCEYEYDTDYVSILHLHRTPSTGCPARAFRLVAHLIAYSKVTFTMNVPTLTLMYNFCEDKNNNDRSWMLRLKYSQKRSRNMRSCLSHLSWCTLFIFLIRETSEGSENLKMVLLSVATCIDWLRY